MNSFNDFPEAQEYAMRAIAPRISYEKFVEKLYMDIDSILSNHQHRYYLQIL